MYISCICGVARGRDRVGTVLLVPGSDRVSPVGQLVVGNAVGRSTATEGAPACRRGRPPPDTTAGHSTAVSHHSSHSHTHRDTCRPCGG